MAKLFNGQTGRSNFHLSVSSEEIRLIVLTHSRLYNAARPIFRTPYPLFAQPGENCNNKSEIHRTTRVRCLDD